MAQRIRQLQHGEQPPAGVTPGRFRNSSGYIRLRWREGPGALVECYEHRWVMGNPPKGTHVHHINGIKDDNRPENLQVVTPEDHRVEHRRIDYSLVARLYADGMSTPAIGRAVGADASSVWRALRAAGAPTRSISESLILWRAGR